MDKTPNKLTHIHTKHSQPLKLPLQTFDIDILWIKVDYHL